MKIYGADNKELMSITSLSREGSALVVKGKIFGAMPIGSEKQKHRNVLKDWSEMQFFDSGEVLFLRHCQWRLPELSRPVLANLQGYPLCGRDLHEYGRASRDGRRPPPLPQ